MIAFDAGVPGRAVAWLGSLLCALACLCGSAPVATAQWLNPPEPISREDEALFTLDSPVGPIDYVAGRGLRLGHTGLNVGGFSTLEIDREEGAAGTIELDSVNFLILFEPVDFLRGFVELEIEQIFLAKTNDDAVESDPALTVERAYGDLVYNDALNLRGGKFQTPVGIWNQVSAEPFTWTATDPVVTETAFDERQTGAELFGSVFRQSAKLDYSLYGQFLGPLDAPKDPNPNDHSVGGRLRYGDALDNWAVGSSFLASERKGDWNAMGGVDALWRHGPLELQGEFAIVRGNIPGRDLWGVYAQGVYDLGSFTRVLRGLHFVTRYEHFDPAGPEANVWNFGLTWYPKPFLILKAGYQTSDRETDDVSRGLFTSISILF